MSVKNNQPEFDDSLLSAYIDSELTAEERAAVEARLEEDPEARELLTEMKSISVKVKSLPRAQVVGNLRAEVLRKIDSAAKLLPPSELSMKKRMLWPLLASAALVMLMFYQPEEKENEVQIARASKVQPDKVQFKAQNESGPSAVPASAATEEQSSRVDGLASAKPDDSPSGDRLTLGQESSKSPAAPAARLSDGQVAQSSSLPESGVGLVHLTLTDLESGKERFNHLLLSNGVQIVEEQKDENASAKARASEAIASDSRLFAETESRGYGGVAADGAEEMVEQSRTNSEKTSAAAEMFLVEASPEQFDQIFLGCNRDTEVIQSLKIDVPPYAVSSPQPSEQLERYWRYEKPARQLKAGQEYVVTPEQRGVFAVLNSLDLDEAAPASSAESTLDTSPQAWATRLSPDQNPADLKQLEHQVQLRRNQAQNFAVRKKGADKLGKLETADESLPQQMRVLFLLHPGEPVKK